jgi:hypothetical protein
LLEAFAAAVGHISAVPREVPPPRDTVAGNDTHVALSIEWTR